MVSVVVCRCSTGGVGARRSTLVWTKPVFSKTARLFDYLPSVAAGCSTVISVDAGTTSMAATPVRRTYWSEISVSSAILYIFRLWTSGRGSRETMEGGQMVFGTKGNMKGTGWRRMGTEGGGLSGRTMRYHHSGPREARNTESEC